LHLPELVFFFLRFKEEENLRWMTEFLAFV
jgi:hypothetical protein